MNDQFDKSLKDLERATKYDNRPKLGKLGSYRSTINLPVNRIIIISLGVLLPLYVFRYELKPKVLEKLPQKYHATIEKIAPAPPDHAHDHSHDEPDDILPGSAAKAPANTHAPDGGDSAKKTAEPEMVLIQGQYYPKSPDNIYVINGKRIFYKDERKSQKK